MKMKSALKKIYCTASATLLMLLPRLARAQSDLGGAAEIQGRAGGGSTEEVRRTVTDILINVVSFVGLIAVVMIVIAGIILVAAGSNDQARERAKKMIIYTVVGIIVIALASAFVLFIARIF